jgi:hypothetical protein
VLDVRVLETPTPTTHHLKPLPFIRKASLMTFLGKQPNDNCADLWKIL